MKDQIRSIQAVRRAVEENGRKRSIFVASTDTPDRYADIVDQATWKIDNYRANPVVQVDHDYRVESTVARGSVATEGGALTLEIDAWAETARAQDVRALVESGIVNAVSVGFRPGRMIPRSQMPPEDPRYGDRGYIMYDCELLEVSIVAIPANPEALAARSLRFDLDALADQVAARLLTSPTYLARPTDGLSHLFPEVEADGLAHLFAQE